MQFKARNLRPIAEMVVGNKDHQWFQYRSSYYITRFFEKCEMDFAQDGSSRVPWAEGVLAELLNDPQPAANQLPERFAMVLRTLMDKREAGTNPAGIRIVPALRAATVEHRYARCPDSGRTRVPAHERRIDAVLSD